MQPPEAAPRSRANLIIGAIFAVLLAGGLVATVASQRPRSTIVAENQGSPVFAAEWTRVPTLEEVERVYPAKARAEGFAQAAKVEMQCIITERGGLSACNVLQESDQGLGFAEAALALADRFELKTEAGDGSSLVGLPVTVPLKFPILPGPPPARPPPGAIS